MTANSVVRARIDDRTKSEAAAVLKAMGLTVSDAFRLMMVKIAKEMSLARSTRRGSSSAAMAPVPGVG
jgi:DNA-damage-inducible protein J